jgi:alpha-L-fucosidase 2
VESGKGVVRVKDGVVTAKKAGTAVIHAYSAKNPTGARAIVVVVDHSVPTKSYNNVTLIMPSTVKMNTGDTKTFNYYMQYRIGQRPKDSRIIVNFGGDGKASLSEIKGKKRAAQALAPGAVVLNTYLDPFKSGSATVQKTIRFVILNPLKAGQMAIKGASSLKVGSASRLSVSVPDNWTENNQTIRWKSENNSVVSVDKNGVITGKKAGTAVITASHGKVTASVTVTVN